MVSNLNSLRFPLRVPSLALLERSESTLVQESERCYDQKWKEIRLAHKHKSMSDLREIGARKLSERRHLKSETSRLFSCFQDQIPTKPLTQHKDTEPLSSRLPPLKEIRQRQIPHFGLFSDRESARVLNLGRGQDFDPLTLGKDRKHSPTFLGTE